MTYPLPVAVLISGTGTNLQAVIDEQEAGHLPIIIKLVISNVESALGLERAKKHGIPTQVISHLNFSSREDFDREVDQVLKSQGVELIVLAGFMRLLSDWFIHQWHERIINVHPSLLPAFPGIHAQQQALDHGVKITGCSVIFVDSGVDTGSIIIQAAVPVYSEDTEASLTQRILKEEHRILPQAIRWIADQEVSVENRRVRTPKLAMDVSVIN